MLPTPSKFHYIFNMRDLSKIVAGLLQSYPDYLPTTKQIVRLWRNEFSRVFCDRLINEDVRVIQTSEVSFVHSMSFDIVGHDRGCHAYKGED